MIHKVIFGAVPPDGTYFDPSPPVSRKPSCKDGEDDDSSYAPSESSGSSSVCPNLSRENSTNVGANALWFFACNANDAANAAAANPARPAHYSTTHLKGMKRPGRPSNAERTAAATVSVSPIDNQLVFQTSLPASSAVSSSAFGASTSSDSSSTIGALRAAHYALLNVKNILKQTSKHPISEAIANVNGTLDKGIKFCKTVV